MKDFLVAFGNILLGFLEALKPVVPIVAACIGASLTIFFNYILSGRAAKRRITRNTISLLSAYLEELQTGLNLINHLLAAIQADNLGNVQWSHLPNKTWSNFPLDPDHLSRLWLLKNRKVEGLEHSLTDLPNDLKNCFDHICINYSALMVKLKEDSERWLDLRFASTKEKLRASRLTSLHDFQKGYTQTISLTRFALERLSAENTRWTIEQKLDLD